MKSWTLIDTETDGLTSPVHIIEISAQRFEGLNPVGEPFHAYLNHRVPIPDDAHSIHGFTADFLSANGEEPSSAYVRFKGYADRSAIVSHFLAFDWNRALMPELLRLGIDSIGFRGFCTWMLSRRALPEHVTHRLDFLREEYDLDCSRPHTAKGDVESTSDLLTRIIFPRLASIGLSTIEEVNRFANITPPLRCKCMVLGLDYGEEQRRIIENRNEHRRLEKFLDAVKKGSYSIPDLILDHELIEESPTISLRGTNFLLTGGFSAGTRPEIAEMILRAGGVVATSKAVTKKTDYLVLGESKDWGWTTLIRGGKLTSAFLRRLGDPLYNFRIIREEDLIASLSGRFEK